MSGPEVTKVRWGLLASIAFVGGCNSCESSPKATPIDAAREPSPSSSITSMPPPITDAESNPHDAAPTLAEVPSTDAGTSSCRLVYGPAEQSFRGPAALVVKGDELRIIVNDTGKPKTFSVPITTPPKGAPSIVPPRPSTFVGMRWPPCELAGRYAYCQGPGGSILRSLVDGPPSASAKSIGQSRAGTRIAAAALGQEHSAVAYLDSRRTTEGNMLQAFVVLDEQEPVRLSDDGAGATTLRVLQRGEAPVVVYLDTRTAMVPIHARQLSLRGHDLALGTDTVVFVGGAPERGIDLSVVMAGSKSFALIPMPIDTAEFGMAAISIEDPPKEDVSAVWSKYPNGIDPAPSAATPARDGKSAWVARVRPRQKEPRSPRILELGRVDSGGAFTSYGEIASGAAVTDISIVEDGRGGVWIAYGDTTVTWLERRMCGAAT